MRAEQLRRSARRRHLLIAADAATIVAATAIATWALVLWDEIPGSIVTHHLLLAAVGIPTWLIVMGAMHLFTERATHRRSEEFQRIVIGNSIAVGLMVAMAFVVRFRALSRGWLLVLLVIATVLLVIERTIARRVFDRLRERGTMRRPVLIVGTTPDAIDIWQATVDRPSLGYDVVGFTGDELGDVPISAYLGTIDETEEVIEATGATGAILSTGCLTPTTINVLTRHLTDSGRHVALSTSLHDIDVARAHPLDLDGTLVMYVEPTYRDGWHATLKRCFDLVASTLALLLLAPVLALVAVAIKLDSRGPILFRQRRVGQGGVEFEMLKFRSMTIDAEHTADEVAAMNEADGPLFKIQRDPRVTRVGRLIRRTSIDELPQLWNVVRNEMSLVGPRPALPGEVAQWPSELRERLRVPPGITGLWQVSGRSATSFAEYKRLDLYYVDNWSMLHDLQILMRTVRAVLTRHGAH